MTPKKRLEILQRFKKANPHPTTELVFHSHFQLLVAVILSAQSTDKGVNKATHELFKVAKTPEDIVDLGLEGLKKYVKTIGLFNTKAKNIMAACKMLIEKYHSKIPNTREDLESLPGVGRKTANVVLNTAFGIPAIAVDTHLFRVCNRTGLAKGKTPLEVEKNLIKVIPVQYQKNLSHWLILHGRYTCTARKPHCKECIIQDLCEYPHKNL